MSAHTVTTYGIAFFIFRLPIFHRLLRCMARMCVRIRVLNTAVCILYTCTVAMNNLLLLFLAEFYIHFYICCCWFPYVIQSAIGNHTHIVGLSICYTQRRLGDPCACVNRKKNPIHYKTFSLPNIRLCVRVFFSREILKSSRNNVKKSTNIFQ